MDPSPWQVIGSLGDFDDEASIDEDNNSDGGDVSRAGSESGQYRGGGGGGGQMGGRGGYKAVQPSDGLGFEGGGGHDQVRASTYHVVLGRIFLNLY